MEKYDSTMDTIDHINTVRRFMSYVQDNIVHRMIRHDHSKLCSPEKELFDEFTPKLKNSTYGSDEYKEFLKSMKVVLDHHYKMNSHHPEHYDIWECPLCKSTFNSEEAPELNGYESKPRFCQKCCPGGNLFEAQLVHRGIKGMSLLDILEMLIDWKSATLRHDDGDILKSIEINQKRFGYSDELKNILLNTIKELNLGRNQNG